MITNQENEIFDRWMQRIPPAETPYFIRDGVVNETAWENAKVKVLYLLKEVNGGSNWDERSYLAEYHTNPDYIKTHSPTINNLIFWQYFITQNRKQLTWLDNIAISDQIQLLSEIAVVNLKKTSGGGVVAWNTFKAFISHEANRNFLEEQLDLYAPDIVICGNTAWYLMKQMGDAFQKKHWKTTSRGVSYLKHNGTIYIDFVHPNIRAPLHMVCFALADAVKEILNGTF